MRRRAAAAYALANDSRSLWAAQKAVEFGDMLLTDSSRPYRTVLQEQWQESCAQAWAPASNTRAISAVVKALKKGTPTEPSSVRYVDNQLVRAAREGPTTATNQLYMDITRAWVLQT
ncbi:MAG: hypothetical protein ACPGR8_13545, partial [Limisphaerales bacterium]